jgi:aspartyl-tRNA(Asn)/glutamyl-tRNA(Gln) amidotransferase subunit A
MDITKMTIKEIESLYHERVVTTEEVIKTFIDHINLHNKEINAVIEVFEEALTEAKAQDERRENGEELGALAGIPIILKDNILVQGHIASAGSKILEQQKASYSATVVERLKKADAIILGRANMDEFAMGGSTEHSLYGATKNPWNIEKIAGGSSGGSIAAVAAGFAPIALGSDTGGSVRQPAALCGVSGLKPTYGRVSRYGLMAMASSLDQISPAARSVEDIARVLQVIEGKDVRDANTTELESTSIVEMLDKNVKGLKIGVPKEYFVEGIDEGVLSATKQVIETLKAEGAVIEEISLPHTKYAIAAYYLIMPSEVSSNMARYDGVRYGYSSMGGRLQESYERTRGEGLGDEVKRRMLLGTFALSAGYYDAYYKKALQVRSLIKKDFDDAFKRVDIILTPTTPSPAWDLGSKVDDPLQMYLEDIFTAPVSLATVPALSVPCGFVDDLPVGVQFIAKPFNEEMLYRVGATYQSLTDWHTRRPLA